MMWLLLSWQICAGTSDKTCTTTVTGGGLMTDLVLTRTEFGPDMPETVQAQVGGSTVALNQHQWNADGTLAKAWQGGRSDGAGGSGIRHVWGRNATSGRLEGIGTEAFGSGATHGIARGYTHTAGGRVEKVWYNAGTLGTPSTSVQGFDYAHDTHGRREAVAPYLPDNAPAAADQPPGWKYGYNERGEVEVADRFTAAGGPSTGVVTHQRRSYDYDLMGNRNTATQGTNVGELKETGYTANILQQYDGITHTRQVEITGQAVAGATVELTLDGGTPVTVNRSLPEHQTGDPDSFRYVHTVGGTDARWLHVSIKASLGGIDITRAGFSHVPPSSEALAYDEDGNLTETAEWDYTWDAENRLTVAEQKSLPVAGGFTAPARKRLEFDYDYKNRRITKRVYQSSGAGWGLTKDLRFVYDGWQMIAELDHTFATGTGLAGSAVNRTFLWGPDLSGSMTGAGGVGGLLSTTYQGITYQACSDANGNITGLVPVSGTGAGTLVARFDYDPFGNRVTNAGPSVELCPFGFSSKYLDVESGMVSYELRGYLPNVGRWMSRDRVEELGGSNLYSLLENDPLNTWDYLGLAAPVTKGKLINAKQTVIDFRSPAVASMNVTEALDILIAVVDGVASEEQVAEDFRPGAAAAYMPFWNKIIYKQSTEIHTFVHESVHVYNKLANSGYWFISEKSDEGMAYAMQFLYQKAKSVADLEDRLEAMANNGKLNSYDVEPTWNAFWSQWSFGQYGSVQGSIFNLSEIDYKRVHQHLKAQMKCSNIAKIFNAKYKCISFFCGTRDEENELDSNNSHRFFTRVYLRNKLPEHFK